MKKSYKANLYNIIKNEFALSPTRFYTLDETIDNKPTTAIGIVDTKLKFYFLNPEHTWDHFKIKQTYFTPNFAESSWIPTNNELLTYTQAEGQFKTWLQNHAKPFIIENDLDDVWNSIRLEEHLLQLTQIEITDKTQFTSDECMKIQASIDSLRKLLVDRFALSDLQLQYTNERLDYLANAVIRLNKFDWVNLLVSILLSIAINMSIDTNTGSIFWELVKTALSQVRGFFISK